MRRSPALDPSTEDCLAGVEMYDDSAILAIFRSALQSHQTKRRPKITGEAGTGGLSRKQKKKALKDNKYIPSGDSSEYEDNKVDLSHLDDFSRNFAEQFLAETAPDGGEGLADDTRVLREAIDAGEGSFTEGQWYPVEGGAYHNCHITVQHHHHYPVPQGCGAETQPSSASPSWTEQRAQAWAEVCAARAAYDVALIKFESVSVGCFDSR